MKVGIQKRKHISVNLMMKRGKSPRAVNIDAPTININIDNGNIAIPAFNK
ncbi:MAG TPA: hypothetical protein VF455_06885 [Chryseobacterium sp.]